MQVIPFGRDILKAKLPEPGGGCNADRSWMKRAIHDAITGDKQSDFGFAHIAHAMFFIGHALPPNRIKVFGPAENPANVR